MRKLGKSKASLVFVLILALVIGIGGSALVRYYMNRPGTVDITSNTQKIELAESSGGALIASVDFPDAMSEDYQGTIISYGANGDFGDGSVGDSFTSVVRLASGATESYVTWDVTGLPANMTITARYSDGTAPGTVWTQGTGKLHLGGGGDTFMSVAFYLDTDAREVGSYAFTIDFYGEDS